MNSRRFLPYKLFFLAGIVIFFSATQVHAEPRNIVFLIGDGMGFEEVRAARLYSVGVSGTLFFETFPYKSQVTTFSANNNVTDSAAAATAIATGRKVDNGVISVDSNGQALETILEHCKDNGKSTGLISTTYITHATPAAFGAHTANRNSYGVIAGDYLELTRPNILLGGGGNGMTPVSAQAAGYTVVTDYNAMLAPETVQSTMVSGQFGESHLPYEYDYEIGADLGYDSYPHLSEMTEFALAVLNHDPDGFFLMVEGGRIDHAGHENNIARNIYETLEFNNAVQIVYDWAQLHPDTLILVTADHETGGLEVTGDNGQGSFPTVFWRTTGHTGVSVPIYAWGVNAEMVSGTLDNTDLYSIAISTAYYCDSDGDGFFASSPSGVCTEAACIPSGCQTDAGVDCDDSDAEINPDICDIIGDYIDQDCDGEDRKEGQTCITVICKDHKDNKACNADPNCQWSGRFKVCEDINGGTEPPSSCSDYLDETACKSNNCRWNRKKGVCR